MAGQWSWSLRLLCPLQSYREELKGTLERKGRPRFLIIALHIQLVRREIKKPGDSCWLGTLAQLFPASLSLPNTCPISAALRLGSSALPAFSAQQALLPGPSQNRDPELVLPALLWVLIWSPRYHLDRLRDCLGSGLHWKVVGESLQLITFTRFPAPGPKLPGPASSLPRS